MTLLSHNEKLIFVLKNNQLGNIIYPYLANYNEKGIVYLNIKKVSIKTINQYNFIPTATDIEILNILNNIEDEAINKKFNHKKLNIKEFFGNIQNNEIYKSIIRPNIENYLSRALELITQNNYQIYIKKKQYINTRPINSQIENLKPQFHFSLSNNQLTYKFQIFENNIQLNIKTEDFHIISQKPCWMVIDNRLIHFDDTIDANKIKPFLVKDEINIPCTLIDNYFENYILKINNKYPIKAVGFDVININIKPKTHLSFENGINNNNVVILSFIYHYKKIYLSNNQKVFSELKKENNKYAINKYIRNGDYEKNIVVKLKSMGLKSIDNVQFMNNFDNDKDNSTSLVEILCQNYNILKELDIAIDFLNSDKKYFIGQVDKKIKITEENDWFDIKIDVNWGKYQIPFYSLKHNITNKIKEFILPDGSIAIIPSEWFEQLGDIALYSIIEENSIKLKKYHFKILEFIPEVKLLKFNELLNNFKKNKISTEVPKNLIANLRNYQVDGFQWISKMEEFSFSCCLADDMGLGKTIQTITVLLHSHSGDNNFETINHTLPLKVDLFSEIETNKTITYKTSLIVVPLSLISNWVNEFMKFAPSLKIFIYFGSHRVLDEQIILKYDIILTTYGTLRFDIELFKQFKYNYIVLDESQNIRNPSTKIYKSIRTLTSNIRLALTGTPIENSLIDLWAQMNFLNPGILGNLKSFKNNYISPIEKQNDTKTIHKLQEIIKPFIIRRTKEEVAKELEPITEIVQYCEMTEEQNKIYETVKSSIRNTIITSFDKSVDKKSLSILILNGLMKLRFLSINPFLIDSSYTKESGKHNEFLSILNQIIQENHKILIFSPFVKHLQFLQQYEEVKKEKFLFLSGSTPQKERQGIVDLFQREKDYKMLFMSLKVGGLGLNITSADYVIILDPWWNPASENQAIARSHRIGQDKKVFVYRFITKNSIEEKIFNLQNKKTNLAKQFINNSNPITLLRNDEILNLFE